MQLDDVLAAARGIGIADHSVQDVAGEHPDLIAELLELDPIATAATFGGLLTAPELQANCLRLEALVHLAVAYSRGRTPPARAFVQRAFEGIGRGYYGQMEDPSEDVFIALVNTPKGNFRVFEGVREGNAFYLQRILNVVETMPRTPMYEHIRDSVEAMLKLSDAIATRAAVLENTLGQELPVKSMPKSIANLTSRYRSMVRFTTEDFAQLKIRRESLTAFGFDQEQCSELLAQHLGHSLLERRPLAFVKDATYVLLPTAIGCAITRFVIDLVLETPNARAFERALANEYSQLFSETPVFGERISAAIPFQRLESGFFGGAMLEVDSGRFLNLVFFVDGLNDFDDEGLSGTNSNSESLAKLLTEQGKSAATEAAGRAGFRDGISLLVFCGFGRGFYLVSEDQAPKNWRFQSIAVHDLITLGWLFEFSALSLWRLLDSEEALKRESTELVNVNGLLNLVAWSREFDGHLVPHGQIPEGFGTSHGSVLVRQNALRGVRHLVMKRWNPRRVQDPEGIWVRVRKFNHSSFEEDNEAPLYVAEEDIRHGRLRAVYAAEKRPWWLEMIWPEDADRHYVYEHWNMLCAWLQRAAPVLDEAYSGLPPGPLSLDFEFTEIAGTTIGMITPRTSGELWALLEISISSDCSSVRIKLEKGFDDGLAQVQNAAERTLVEALVLGVSRAAGEESDEGKRAALLQNICPNSDAKWMHRFQAQSFQDRIFSALDRKPILLDQMDAAAARVGLGWRIRSRSAGREISGIPECTFYLNEVVRAVLDDLCNELGSLNRTQFVTAVLKNYESAAHDRDIWRRTARAVIALHDDTVATMETMVRHDGALNAVFGASRILLEAAVCECPLEQGGTPGVLDLSRAMSHAMTAFHFGGWSDAIHWGAMEPLVRITPLGDVHMRHEFMETIYEPFARAGAEILVKHAADSYTQLYEIEKDRQSFEEVVDAAFIDAWRAEFGTSLDGFRAFVDQLEDVGENECKPVLRFKRSDLISMLGSAAEVSPHDARATLEVLTMFPRSEWRAVSGDFKNKDWFPWRFRRRLSTLRRPFFQVDRTDDAAVIVAPGLVRQAFAASMGWFYHGEIPQGQAQSLQMRRWIGNANNVQRTKFNTTVESRMRELGWDCDKEVKITKILGRSLDRDYGDIDVLAWQPASGRVLAMECKDLQFLKSLGEVAEQLSDFRGEIRADGKPDHLRKHLNRLDILNANRERVSKALKLNSDIRLEGHLVFKNPVPMKFAWEKMASKVRLSLFSELQNL
jgi:hypothetical protein